MEIKRWFRLKWQAFAEALGGFLDEAASRTVLVFEVITGRLPREMQRRHWNRNLDAPVLIDVEDWTNDRKIFSVLVWHPLESPLETCDQDHLERVSEVKEIIARGASEKAVTTLFKTNYGLKWDADRKVWTSTAEDGGEPVAFAYDEQAKEVAR